MSRNLAASMAVLTAAMIAHPALAINIQVTPTVVGAFDASGTPTDSATNLNALPLGVHVFEVEFRITVNELAPDEAGFGNIAFNVDLSDNLERPDPPFPISYAPVSTSVDHDNSAFTDPIPLFADNADFGVADDLRDIIVGLDPLSLTAADMRLAVGTESPAPIGKVFVAFDGSDVNTTGSLTLNFGGASSIKGGRLELAPDAQMTADPLVFAVVPEPSAFVLLLVAATVRIGQRKRRRQ